MDSGDDLHNNALNANKLYTSSDKNDVLCDVYFVTIKN